MRSDMTEFKKVGRPTDYNPKIAELICDRVASHDMGLRRLTDMYDDMPDKVTINIWRRKHPEFRSQYALAKAEQLEFCMEDLLEIADDATNDWMEKYDSETDCIGWRINGEHIQRSRVRIDTRKWIASKLAPKIYGNEKRVEELEGENERVKAELQALRDKLNKANTAEY